jgi:DNA-binding response OmpR family regulator
MAETILIVANDPVVRNQLVWALAEHGYRFFTTSDGGGSILQVGFIQPGLVILNIPPDGQDRWKTLQRIREMSPVPVIVLTGSEDDEGRSECLERGADCCLSQPFNERELQARARALLRRVQYKARSGREPQAIPTYGKHAS